MKNYIIKLADVVDHTTYVKKMLLNMTTFDTEKEKKEFTKRYVDKREIEIHMADQYIYVVNYIFNKYLIQFIL